MQTFLSGFGIGLGLIVAIGAQNAFVLRQGLKKEHVAPVVAVCALCDFSLILLGVLGFGTLVARFPLLTSAAAWGGAVFLIVYGAWAFRSAWRGSAGLRGDEAGDPLSRRGAVLTALALSLLNPHVYLDTVVLIGSIAAQYEDGGRVSFWAGASVASLVWFSILGFGASFLAPVFERGAAWRVLDALIALVMWALAFGLISGQL